MAFEPRRFVENARGTPGESKQLIGDDNAGREGSGTGAQTFTEWDAVDDVEPGRWKCAVCPGRHCQCGLPDEVVLSDRNEAGIPAAHGDGEFRIRDERAFEVHLKSDAERIEA